ncbi:MAG: hypothetical protein MUF40_01370 [Gemmatimonadaceae bacterium]|nr:hypothetical protein [Gemmatimonadaceae bacterium]
MPRPTGRLVPPAERAQRLATRIVAGFGVGYGLAAMVGGSAVAVAAGLFPAFSREMIGFMLLAGMHGIPTGVVAGIVVRTVGPVRAHVLVGALPMAAFGAAVATAAAPLFPLPLGTPMALVALVQGRDAPWVAAGWRFVAASAPVGLVAGAATWLLLRRWVREARPLGPGAPTPEQST